jgi:hypothetical protein
MITDAGANMRVAPAGLFAYAEPQRTVYHARWIGSLWQRAFVDSPEALIGKGWDECLAAFHRLKDALDARDGNTDPCELTGAGWIAEEALATGLLCSCSMQMIRSPR